MLVALPDDAALAGGLLRAADDVPRLLTYAQRHGVLPYLACHLRASASEPLRASLRSTEELRALSHAVGLHAVGIATQALAAAGVRSLSLKGPLLSARLYDPPFARPSLDLDLLVTRDDFVRALDALAAVSWTSAPGASSAASLARHHHVQLTSETLPALELHFAATSSFGTQIRAEDLLARARTVSVGAVTADVPSEIDELVYLAAHAAAHRVERLGWLYDLALLLRRGPDLHAVLSRARQLHLGRAVHAMLALTDQSFALRVPLPPLDPLQRAALASLAWGDGDGSPASLQSAARAAFIAALSDAPGRGLRHLGKKLRMRVTDRTAS